VKVVRLSILAPTPPRLRGDADRGVDDVRDRGPLRVARQRHGDQ
jgi:hypothetical protein